MKLKNSGITIYEENNPQEVIRILRIAKGSELSAIDQFFYSALEKISNYYFHKGLSKCYIARLNNHPVAGIIYFFYKDKMIYYEGSTIPEHKNSGAMSLIISESVRLNCVKYKVLDFDGSMIEGIERFFRGFNSYPVHYSCFSLNRLPLLLKPLYKLYSFLRHQ